MLEKLEEKLDLLLGEDGGIASAEKMKSVVDMLGASAIPEWKALILSALHATKSKDFLKAFVDLNGLVTLSAWMVDFKSKAQFKHLRTLLEVLNLLPITIENLQSCNIGKTVNKLNKESDNPGLKNNNNYDCIQFIFFDRLTFTIPLLLINQ